MPLLARVVMCGLLASSLFCVSPGAADWLNGFRGTFSQHPAATLHVESVTPGAGVSVLEYRFAYQDKRRWIAVQVGHQGADDPRPPGTMSIYLAWEQDETVRRRFVGFAPLDTIVVVVVEQAPTGGPEVYINYVHWHDGGQRRERTYALWPTWPATRWLQIQSRQTAPGPFAGAVGVLPPPTDWLAFESQDSPYGLDGDGMHFTITAGEEHSGMATDDNIYIHVTGESASPNRLRAIIEAKDMVILHTPAYVRAPQREELALAAAHGKRFIILQVDGTPIPEGFYAAYPVPQVVLPVTTPAHAAAALRHFYAQEEAVGDNARSHHDGRP